jgi:hypothetical protein
MQKEDRCTISTFRNIVDLGVSHFKGLYKELERVNINEIVNIASFFPSYVGEDKNDCWLRKYQKMG